MTGAAARRARRGGAVAAAAWPAAVFLLDSLGAFGGGWDEVPRLFQCLVSGWAILLAAAAGIPWILAGDDGTRTARPAASGGGERPRSGPRAPVVPFPGGAPAPSSPTSPCLPGNPPRL